MRFFSSGVATSHAGKSARNSASCSPTCCAAASGSRQVAPRVLPKGRPCASVLPLVEVTLQVGLTQPVQLPLNALPVVAARVASSLLLSASAGPASAARSGTAKRLENSSANLLLHDVGEERRRVTLTGLHASGAMHALPCIFARPDAVIDAPQLHSREPRERPGRALLRAHPAQGEVVLRSRACSASRKQRRHQ